MSTKGSPVQRKRRKSESGSGKQLEKDPHRKDSRGAPPHQSHRGGDHGHHNRSDHQDGDHHYKGDHHSHHGAHPIRPRAGTMTRKDTAHSLHHESDRRSTGTGEIPSPIIVYENTYKLVPDSRFHEGQVREIIKNVFTENIREKQYDAAMCGSKCKLMSEIIKERVKHLNMDRFKIVCVVMMGQEAKQSMLVSSRCLWDQRFDNHVTVEFKKGNLVALGLVFAVYAE